MTDATDPNPRLEEIAKAAAEINPMSSEEAFETIVEGINKVPEQLQMMINSIVSIQDEWPMPAEGWKQFKEDVERTNERLGLDLHVTRSFRFVNTLEKYAASIDKTRDELDENERKQAMMNAVLAEGEKSMTESPSYIMYTAEMIRLIRATLKGTTEPMVPFKVDPLEFCQEAHKVKDELVSNALNLLDNDISMEQKEDDGWISVEKLMPHEDALYLIHAPSLDPDKPFIHTAWFNPGNDIGWQLIPIPFANAVTHWMPLPWPPNTGE